MTDLATRDDLTTRDDVDALLRRFYGRVFADDVLAEPFSELRERARVASSGQMQNTRARSSRGYGSTAEPAPSDLPGVAAPEIERNHGEIVSR
jgi:hypothetical protein